MLCDFFFCNIVKRVSNICSSIIKFAEQSLDPEMRASFFSPRLMEVSNQLALITLIYAVFFWKCKLFYWHPSTWKWNTVLYPSFKCNRNSFNQKYTNKSIGVLAKFLYTNYCFGFNVRCIFIFLFLFGKCSTFYSNILIF